MELCDTSYGLFLLAFPRTPAPNTHTPAPVSTAALSQSPTTSALPELGHVTIKQW